MGVHWHDNGGITFDLGDDTELAWPPPTAGVFAEGNDLAQTNTEALRELRDKVRTEEATPDDTRRFLRDVRDRTYAWFQAIHTSKYWDTTGDLPEWEQCPAWLLDPNLIAEVVAHWRIRPTDSGVSPTTRRTAQLEQALENARSLLNKGDAPSPT